MSDKLSRLVDAVGVANRQRAEHLDRTASMRRARFIAAVHPPPPPRRAVWWWLAGVSVAAAVALVLLFVLPVARLELRVDGEAVGTAAMITAGEDPVEVAFSDGTRMWARPGARLHVSTGEHGAAIALTSGTVEMSVKPQPDAQWRVLAGPYAIEVVGTEFSASWSAERLVVEVRKGEVCVVGPDVDRCLRGDERLVAEATTTSAVARTPAEPDPPIGSAPAPEPRPGEQEEGASPSSVDDPATKTSSARDPARRRPGSGRSSTNRWAELAAKGDYDAAFEHAAVGGFVARCRRASASQLEELADIARFAGKTTAAREALTLLRTRFPTTAGGRRAAYRLGRLEFEQARRYGAAAKWFDLYLQENPRGALAQAALGRLVESLDRSGDTAKARRAAQRYLDRYPRGAHADIARAVQSSHRAR
ncbi:MAG: FecR domain-containing protein [Myxococcota bacterium]